MTELVSVVVPTFNRSYCLAGALDSALGQSHAAVEVIVVDDGSTDRTAGLLRERYGGDARVRCLRQENAGVCAARNAGLAAARGDFVAFLDSDDSWKPWKLELQLACFRARPDVGMVWTDMEAVDAGGAVVSPRYLRTMYSAYRWFTSEDLFAWSRPLREIPGVPAEVPAEVAEAGRFWAGDVFSPMVMGNLVHTSTVVLRRSRLSAVGGFDESLGRAGEDHDFHLRTCREGPVGFVDVPSIAYRVGMPDRLTRHDDTIALNYLRVLTRTLAEDRDRITLPPRMLEEALAKAHAWVAGALAERGDRAGARTHYLASLRHKPWQPRTCLKIGVGLMPRPLGDAVRSLRRSVLSAAGGPR